MDIEWVIIDKQEDLFFFKDISSMSKYLDLTNSQVYSIIHWSRNNICYYSPSKKVYIQRLFNNPVLHPPAINNWNNSYKNRKNIEWLGKIYINNNNG